MQPCAFGVVGVLAAAVIVGCAGSGITAPVDSPVTIERSELFLTVRNVADGPLSDLTIGIKPAGVRPEYQTQVRRLAAGEELDIPYAEFRGVDRDPLMLQNINPRSVHITATALNGGTHDVQLPWPVQPQAALVPDGQGDREGNEKGREVTKYLPRPWRPQPRLPVR